MKELNNKELMDIMGGANYFSASFFNAAARAIDTIMDIGRSLGSAVRRAFSGKVCPL